MAKKLLHKTAGRAPTSAAPKRTPTGRSGGTSGKLSVKKIPKTPVVTTKGKTLSMAGERAVTVPTRTGRKAVVRSKAVKVSGKYFTPKQAKVLTGIRKGSGPIAGLDAEQSRVAKTILKVGAKSAATPREKLAAIETGLVESSLRNLDYGDADSLGWRQERTSQYGAANALDVKGGAKRFFDEIKTEGAGAATPGLAAQGAQGSAFPDRYDETEPQARQIIRDFKRGRVNKKAVKKAKKLGVKAPLKATGGQLVSAGKPPKKVMSRFKALKKSAQKLEKAGLPYEWGGGHVAGAVPFDEDGLDCSSAVSAVLQRAGVKIPTLTSGNFGAYLKPGAGAATVYYNSGHVFMKIGKRFFGTSGSNPAGGPGWIEGGVDVSGYNVAHVPGLGKKTALKMGVPVGPGSSGGASAMPSTAIASFAAKTGQSPASVKRKLKSKKLTPQQILGKLEKHGVGVDEPEADAAPDASLAELERKYGAKAPRRVAKIS